jgi:hypothetical protein
MPPEQFVRALAIQGMHGEDARLDDHGVSGTFVLCSLMSGKRTFSYGWVGRNSIIEASNIEGYDKPESLSTRLFIHESSRRWDTCIGETSLKMTESDVTFIIYDEKSEVAKLLVCIETLEERVRVLEANEASGANLSSASQVFAYTPKRQCAD